jgi:hypothetical protein
MNPIWLVLIGVAAIPLLRIIGMLVLALLLKIFWK